MRKLVILSLALFAMTTSTAQAHNVGKSSPDLIGRYVYLKANYDHATQFLVENASWQVVNRKSDVEVIEYKDVRYHQRLLHNSYIGILNLIPHRRQWKCIHHYEGAWNANTGNGFYGGLQMDLSFQSSHGDFFLRHKGTANNWTPLEQMLVAEVAYQSGRGFHPWPNTARYCGLL